MRIGTLRRPWSILRRAIGRITWRELDVVGVDSVLLPHGYLEGDGSAEGIRVDLRSAKRLMLRLEDGSVVAVSFER